MSLWDLRLRALLDRQFATVAAVLVVCALVGGFATYTAHVDPGTTTEERVVATWESSGTFDHAATVTRENPLFPVGRTLEDRQVYFSSIAPTVNGSYAFGYRASDGGTVETSVDVVLVTRSVGEQTGDQSGGATVLWERSRTLHESDAATVAPGDDVRAPFSFNASAVESERGRIEDRLGGGVGTVETFVRATVDIEGTVNGERVDRQAVHTLPVTIEGNTYRVGPAEASGQQFETTQSVTVPRTYGPLRSVGGPALLALSLAGLAGLAVGRSRYRLELTDAEREWLAYREDRSEFDEWITSFRLPFEAFDRPEAEAASLADLVDFAIDTDSGVIEAPDETEYYVVHDDVLYTYTAPRTPPRGLVSDPESQTALDAESEAATDAESERTDDSESEATGLEAAALDLGFGASGDENGTSDGTDEPPTRDAEETDPGTTED
ncbi:DUF5305 domain-containing protein [Salinigranum marinum]|uniref:DUF5305 domain-containing protein n=1 Tax=Salinigranum marinum TaxID=1515595 RepID=UPI002989E12D|nr:DUF5305 domain-containing protein [Salinigranum marinum]